MIMKMLMIMTNWKHSLNVSIKVYLLLTDRFATEEGDVA
jgi:hypothetical protein